MNRDFFSSINNNQKKCNKEINKLDSIKSKCQNINCNPYNRCCYVIGPSGTALNYADFYALMPPDNSATVAPGTDVSFPQDGPNSGASITRTGASSFNLSEIGTYQVFFNVPVSAHLVIIQIA